MRGNVSDNTKGIRETVTLTLTTDRKRSTSDQTRQKKENYYSILLLSQQSFYCMSSLSASQTRMRNTSSHSFLSFLPLHPPAHFLSFLSQFLFLQRIQTSSASFSMNSSHTNYFRRYLQTKSSFSSIDVRGYNQLSYSV